MAITDSLAEFRRATEAKWSNTLINPTIYGFQIQQGTRWNVGLSVKLIEEYESVLSSHFPNDLRSFLLEMNGTDLPELNVNAPAGSQRESAGVYSYPRDIEIVKTLVERTRTSKDEIISDLAWQGFDLTEEASLVPIYGHRYVVCTPDLNSSTVLSIVVHDTDAIVYGNSLMEYLETEFLGATS
jgi:hypothetical protein